MKTKSEDVFRNSEPLTSRIPAAKPSAAMKADGNGNGSGEVANFLPEEHFRRMLARERKRSERSRKHLVLMLIDGGLKNKKTDALLEQIAVVLGASIRETDLAGWFEANSVFGVIFTEFGDSDVSAAVKTIEAKVTAGLQNAFKATQLSSFQISFYAFPDGWKGGGHQRPVDPTMYPDLFEVKERKKVIAFDQASDGRARRVGSPDPFVTNLSSARGSNQIDFERPYFLPSGASWPIRFAICIFEVPVHVCFHRRCDP